jgi:hypothetical protein
LDSVSPASAGLGLSGHDRRNPACDVAPQIPNISAADNSGDGTLSDEMMSRSSGFRVVRGRNIAGMAAARDTVRCPHHDLDPQPVAGLPRLGRGPKRGEKPATFGGRHDTGSLGNAVSGRHRTIATGGGGFVDGPMLGRRRLLRRDVDFDLDLAHAVLPLRHLS